jgi:hypothetical protein
MNIVIEQIDKDRLDRAAFNPNSYRLEVDDRMRVNALKHDFTLIDGKDYDYAQHHRVDFNEIKEAVLKQIAAQYPNLAGECQRQTSRMTGESITERRWRERAEYQEFRASPEYERMKKKMEEESEEEDELLWTECPDCEEIVRYDEPCDGCGKVIPLPPENLERLNELQDKRDAEDERNPPEAE